jgi:hypothetical protein
LGKRLKVFEEFNLKNQDKGRIAPWSTMFLSFENAS